MEAHSENYVRKLGGKEMKYKNFAYDGCHKIYVLANEAEEKEADDCGYQIHPMPEIKDTYDGSCSLKFISFWNLDKQTIVRQFEKPFEYEWSVQRKNQKANPNAFARLFTKQEFVSYMWDRLCSGEYVG